MQTLHNTFACKLMRQHNLLPLLSKFTKTLLSFPELSNAVQMECLLASVLPVKVCPLYNHSLREHTSPRTHLSTNTRSRTVSTCCVNIEYQSWQSVCLSQGRNYKQTSPVRSLKREVPKNAVLQLSRGCLCYENTYQSSSATL